MQAPLALKEIPAVLMSPRSVFTRLGSLEHVSCIDVLFRYALWIGLIPPVSIYFGTHNYGWQFGAGDPVFISEGSLLAICIAYFCILLFSFFAVSYATCWMSATYAARKSLGHSAALISICGTPLVVGSVFHLYPSLALNVGVLIPVILWAVWLLYIGLPEVLCTNLEQGMLMASSIIGFLLVSISAFLTVTVLLWVEGFGPGLAI